MVGVIPEHCVIAIAYVESHDEYDRNTGQVYPEGSANRNAEAVRIRRRKYLTPRTPLLENKEKVDLGGSTDSEPERVHHVDAARRRVYDDRNRKPDMGRSSNISKWPWCELSTLCLLPP
jgi:hypothetical protein